MNFEEVYEEFKIYAMKRHKKQSFITLSVDFNNHILPYFKGKNLVEITKNDIIAWQNNILDLNFSNSYNSKLYSFFCTFMKYCILCGYITDNLVLMVGNFPHKIEQKEHCIYTLSQFLKFRKNIDNYIYKSYFTFMYFYGTRPGETMALRFSDYSKGIIFINHNLQRKGTRELDTPKNIYSLRHFKINLFMRIILYRLKLSYIKSYGKGNDYFIFGGNKPLSPTTIDRIKMEAIKKSKLPYITQHEFRHSYCSRNIRKKVPIAAVAKSLGHGRISTTLDIYTH